jgi:hypothetical protein
MPLPPKTETYATGTVTVYRDDKPQRLDQGERLAIPVEPQEALRALLQVDPQSPPVDPAD